MISAVIPLYNKRDSVARAIRSVLAQESRPDELIIVNDGSTDGSERLVADLLGSELHDGGFIKLLNTSNQGVSAARNTGIAAASHRYVCLLDADDVWLPTHCSTLRNMIEAHPGCGLYISGNFKSFTVPSQQHAPGSVCTLEPIDFFTRYAKKPNFVHTSAVAIEKGAWEAIGGFPRSGIRSQDVYTWLRIASAFPVCVHDGVTAVQLLDDGGLGRRARELPYYLRYFAEHPEAVPSPLQRPLRKIMRRGAVASWIASHASGYDIAGDLSRTLARIDPLAAWLFRVAHAPLIRSCCARLANRFMARKMVQLRCATRGLDGPSQTKSQPVTIT